MRLAATGDHVGEIVKATPPVSVAGLSLAGVTLNQWVMVLTLIYTAMQIAWFVYSKLIRKDK